MPKHSLMDQYFSIKEHYKDGVLLFQVGGFYQCYYHDAVLVSEKLGTKLISRPIGGGKRAPMCGLPVDRGPARAEQLAQLGCRVALCRQGEEKDKSGMARREVFQVVGPSEGVERIDLTQEWEDYLANNTFEDQRAPGYRRGRKTPSQGQDDLLSQLRAVNIEDMTPMEAMTLLYEWKKQFAV